MYASMIELLDRFVEEGWPLVERGLLKDGGCLTFDMQFLNWFASEIKSITNLELRSLVLKPHH